VSRHPRLRALVVVAVTGLAVTACGGGRRATGAAPAPASTTTTITTTTRASTGTGVIDPGDGGNYQPKIDPADFVERIDNPYLPLEPGSTWLYEGTVDGERQRVKVVVKPERRRIMGISAVVVSDTVFDADGQPVEITTDWYAQDSSGNVWYLGEDSKEIEDGKVKTTQGSWVAGVDGALPGIIMLAAPTPGRAYRQEFYRGEAEDMAQVIRLDATARVRAGSYGKVLVTREWTPLEPKNLEDKYYAKGVGNVLMNLTAGERGRFELIRFIRGSG
jgi:hypothetical protein